MFYDNAESSESTNMILCDELLYVVRNIFHSFAFILRDYWCNTNALLYHYDMILFISI